MYLSDEEAKMVELGIEPGAAGGFRVRGPAHWANLAPDNCLWSISMHQKYGCPCPISPQGHFSAAINAEKTRSALCGLTVDRRETNHFHAIENMSREEVEGRLGELRKSHPGAFIDVEYKVINGAKTRDSSVEETEEEDTPALEHHTD